MKVLTGEGYTQGRLLGILHEMWTTHLGRAVNVGDTVYASGNVVVEGDGWMDNPTE